MDLFRIMAWFDNNRKKILIFSHVTIILAIINLVGMFLTESLHLYKNLFISGFILQLVVFVCIQVQFKEKDWKI